MILNEMFHVNLLHNRNRNNYIGVNRISKNRISFRTSLNFRFQDKISNLDRDSNLEPQDAH